MASIHIIYGTTGGNTEMVTDRVAMVLEKKGHRVTNRCAEQSHCRDFLKGDLTIVASPTYGHGLLQEAIQNLIADAKKEDITLKKRPYAVIGLGDVKYEPEYHIESANILDGFLKGMGGIPIVPPLKISHSPVLYLDSRIEEWANRLSDALKS